MPDYVATGAGEAPCNQTYTYGGVWDSHPYYVGDTDPAWRISYAAIYTGWIISAHGLGDWFSSDYPATTLGGATPPLETYQIRNGVPPAPTLAAYPPPATGRSLLPII